jgi:hypothetical protein
MHRSTVGALVVVAGVASSVEAESEKREYTAFELTEHFVLQTRRSAAQVTGALFQGGSILPCSPPRVDASTRQLRVERNKSCPLFLQASPAKFTFVADITADSDCSTGNNASPDCARTVNYEFSPGIDVRGNYRANTLDTANEWNVAPGTLEGCIASLGDEGWKKTEHVFVATSSRLAVQKFKGTRQGTVYLRLGKCEAPNQGKPILRLSYTSAIGEPAPFPMKMDRREDYYCKRYETPCTTGNDESPYPGAGITWVLYVDQATDTGVPGITYNPDNYIAANSFGRVRVRHSRNVAPALSLAGAGAALTMPSDSGGASEKATSTIGASILANDGDSLISEFVVGPRAPGALSLAIKFVDVTDPTKSRGEVGVDILVDKVYSSALRFGLSRVFRLDDVEYVGVQADKDGPYFIKRHAAPPHEVVLGLSLYSEWLWGRGGRRYFLTPYYNGARDLPKVIWHHTGLYIGIGALSYSPSNLDFMKSVHAGIEIEATPNLSIAFTVVIRRTPKLDEGLFVGDEVPTASVSTTDAYRGGLGIVINFSTDFLKFAAKGGQ